MQETKNRLPRNREKHGEFDWFGHEDGNCPFLWVREQDITEEELEEASQPIYKCMLCGHDLLTGLHSYKVHVGMKHPDYAEKHGSEVDSGALEVMRYLGEDSELGLTMYYVQQAAEDSGQIQGEVIGR